MSSVLQGSNKPITSPYMLSVSSISSVLSIARISVMVWTVTIVTTMTTVSIVWPASPSYVIIGNAYLN
jgi:hypothetical protein